MISVFEEDVDGKKLNNTHLMPRRNWCEIQMFDESKESEKFELEFVLNVERDRRDASGKTKAYEIKVAALTVVKV
jgi:hypothetical protein